MLAHVLPAAEQWAACLRDPFTVTPKAYSGQAPSEFSIQGTVGYKVLCFHGMVQTKFSKLFTDRSEHHLSSDLPR